MCSVAISLESLIVLIVLEVDGQQEKTRKEMEQLSCLVDYQRRHDQDQEGQVLTATTIHAHQIYWYL